jgi:DNA-nicking Smr family endonuclease
MREALSDAFDAETLLHTDEHLSYRHPGVGPDVVRKLRQGQWRIQAELDLHGSRTDEAREQLGAFVREAARLGLRCVRIIHGKGLGSPGKTPVLKSRVHSWLAQKTEVMAFVQARPAEGGAGALVVLLRPSGSNPAP